MPSPPLPARQCFRCGVPISACMGFVAAGDVLRVWRGEIPASAIRERCGRCAEWDSAKGHVGTEDLPPVPERWRREARAMNSPLHPELPVPTSPLFSWSSLAVVITACALIVLLVWLGWQQKAVQ